MTNKKSEKQKDISLDQIEELEELEKILENLRENMPEFDKQIKFLAKEILKSLNKKSEFFKKARISLLVGKMSKIINKEYDFRKGAFLISGVKK